MFADRPRLATRLVRAGAVATVLALAGTACSGVTAEQSATSGAAVTQLTIATSFAISDIDPAKSGYWAPEFGYGALLMKPVRGGELGRGCWSRSSRSGRRPGPSSSSPSSRSRTASRSTPQR